MCTTFSSLANRATVDSSPTVPPFLPPFPPQPRCWNFERDFSCFSKWVPFWRCVGQSLSLRPGTHFLWRPDQISYWSTSGCSPPLMCDEQIGGGRTELRRGADLWRASSRSGGGRRGWTHGHRGEPGMWEYQRVTAVWAKMTTCSSSSLFVFCLYVCSLLLSQTR